MAKKAAKQKPVDAERPQAGPKWTIAVFMVGDAELRPSIERDVVELQRAGSSKDVNVVASVQLSADAATDWYEIEPRDPDDTKLAKLTREAASPRQAGLDVNDSLNLFLKHVASNYEADFQLLILWGHASGLGFGRLGPGSKQDLVRVGMLGASLDLFRENRPSRRKLDILGLCACALSKAEFAIELRDHADFLVSSQVGVSTLMTWPFDRIVHRVLMSPHVNPGQLACQMVRIFEASYEPPPVALTALKLNNSEVLGSMVDSLSKVVLKALAVPGKVGRINNLCVLEAFQQAIEAYPFELEPLVDFFDFCGKLVGEEGLDPSVRDEARKILDEGSQMFVIENVRSGPKFGSLNGLSILAPDFDNPETPKVAEEDRDYSKSSKAWLWQNTSWSQMTQTVQQFVTANPEFAG